MGSYRGIVGRDPELAVLSAAVAAAAAGRGSLVLVEGAPGLGKTTLLRAACAGAAVDDAHWADVPSLRWLAHLAARIESLPVALLLALRDGSGEPAAAGELRACPACTPLRLGPLEAQATAALVRQRLGAQAGDELCLACHASTGGNPFLLEALATALRAPGDGDLLAWVDRLGPEPVARAVLRRVGQLGDGAGRLTRALAILGGPAPLRHAVALAGQDTSAAARLADRLRAADVLAPGSVLEFAHPIVRTAVYESIPPGERALAHAEAARLAERDGADPERITLHLLRNEPAGDARAVELLRAAAAAASGRRAPGPAADYLRRALDEPPEAASRPAILLDLGLALARERSPAAPAAPRDAVALAITARDHGTAALLAARVLGIWGHHDSAAVICREALARAGPDVADSLEAELYANTWISAATVAEATVRARARLAAGMRPVPGACTPRWRRRLPGSGPVMPCGLDIENPAVASWRTAAAAAHTALGHREQAASLAGEQLALARKTGTAATLGAALRVYAATAPRHEAGSALAEAVDLLEATSVRYELALALADLGTHLRRTGRPGQARAPLRRALDLAQRCGATPLAGRARQELLATGARPRRTALTGPDALTSGERRVVGLAAAGMSNRHIAQHLFITLPTVEPHLRHAFGKLGITSRAGLPAQLASQARPASLPDEPALAVTELAVPDGRDRVKGPG